MSNVIKFLNENYSTIRSNIRREAELIDKKVLEFAMKDKENIKAVKLVEALENQMDSIEKKIQAINEKLNTRGVRVRSHKDHITDHISSRLVVNGSGSEERLWKERVDNLKNSILLEGMKPEYANALKMLVE